MREKLPNPSKNLQRIQARESLNNIPVGTVVMPGGLRTPPRINTASFLPKAQRSLAQHVTSIPYKWGVRTTGASSVEAWHKGTFDRTLYSKCGPDEIALGHRTVKTAEACEQACRRHGECYAVEWTGAKSSCRLMRQCLHRLAISRVSRNGVSTASNNVTSIMHRWGPSLPRHPSLVRWQTNASLVISSFDASLSWLSQVRPGYMDVTVYQKRNFGIPADRSLAKPDVRQTRQYVLRMLCQHGTVRRGHDAEGPADNCAPDSGGRRHHLAYWTTLPNYGRTSGDPKKVPRGGAREPYVFFQFILDFWDNLPNVVIFTQDDCLKFTGCTWLRLPRLYPALEDWTSRWSATVPFSRDNCFCRLVYESTYSPSTRYFWFRWMSFLQEQLFNETANTRRPGISWPIDATFAVGRANIRQQPYWLYEVLLRTLVVEEQCMHTGSIMWAHSYERLWFEILDGRVPKVPRYFARSPHGSLDLTQLAGECLYGTPQELEDRRRQLRRL